MNYFEYVILLVQDYILVAIVMFYRRQLNTKTVLITVSYFIVASLFAASIFPKSILTFMIVSVCIAN